MTCEFPRTYEVVRQGRPEPVRVDDLDGLITLRTELELLHQFGAGATTGLIEAFDRHIADVSSRRPADGAEAERVRELEDMRAILGDSLSPLNGQAIATIDRDCPQAIAGVPMGSIEKETQAFRDDVKGELAGRDDADALLAAFAEADQEAGSTKPAAVSAEADLDQDLQALLAEASGQSDPAEAGLAELAASIAPADEPVASNESVLPPLTRAAEIDATVEPINGSPPAQPTVTAVNATAPSPQPEASTDAGEVDIEGVTEHVAQSLTTAEAQLDAIASAFEVAAVELGQMTSEVTEAAGLAVQPAEADQDVPARIAAWDADAGPVDNDEPGASLDQNSQPVEAGNSSPGTFARAVVPAADAPPLASASASTRPAGQLRAQLKQARANILCELDEVLVMLERVDRMQGQAEQAVRKAREFEQAAARAQAAGQTLAVAEAEAAKARAAFEEAQSRAAGARQAWEQAQQTASSAAETCQFEPW